ncbi:MAG: PilC/PilY family type IV pilus protein [Gallionella sp.]|nr:PilC/PilY family type IV pilus protein [Gallionella sp.]
MKRHLKKRTTACQLLSVALAVGLALPLPALADSVALTTKPLATATTSTVLPNVMFILDDSGSMAYNYLPDWANDSHPVTGTNYTSMPELFRNNGFNGVAYNPAITYTPPVLYNADGTLNTTTYPNIPSPWTAVKNDAYGVQSTGTSNLVGSASHYVFVPGEYCSSPNMTSCVTATAPATVSGILYDKPAGLRWCNSAALTTCQSINNSTYRYPRYPGLSVAAAGATATITVATGGGGNTSVTSIKVNNLQILSGSTGTQSSNNNLASAITTNINNCTAGTSGNCQIAGYSASRSGSVVTITAPLSMGAITHLPAITIGAGSRTVTPTAFSGYTAAFTVPGSNLLTNIVSTTTSYPYPGTTAKASTRTDCAGTTCTYAEEMTNYANWWTYYHTRLQAMKTSVSRAFKTLDNRFRVGFTTISDTGASNGTSFSNAKFLGNDIFELAHKNRWFTKLFGAAVASATPLRGSLSKVGRYYANKISGEVDPVQYSCQQNFVILSTDGYWNTNDETSTYKNINLTGGLVGDLDNDPNSRPMYEGPTASSGSLADVAKYYYDTDLRTSALSNCTGGTSTDFPAGNPDVCTNNVFVSSTDNNLKQHMTTFTMGLGADGTLNYTSDYKDATSGDYFNLKNGLCVGSPCVTVDWPDPIANSAGERIDDLWHAAVNGQGLYFSAKNPDSIITGFNAALSSITQKLGAAAAAATSTLNPVAGNNFAYVASYTTNVWKGNLESRPINTTTGVVSETANWCVENVAAQTCAAPGTVVPDTSGSSTIYNCVVTGSTAGTCASPGVFDTVTSECKTEIHNACTGTMPAKVAAASDTRTIYTAPAGALVPLTGQNLVPFDAAYAAANPTNFAAAHINGLNQWSSISAQHTGVKLINYLRGQNGFEDRAANAINDRLYRTREAVLGDALESQPAFISKPVFSYPYAGYSDFKTAQASRAGTVYMGTNDGMMHAFAASNGAERWAYVPSMVIPNMWKLASTSYSNNHVNFVNGSPVTTDICTANCGTGSTTAVWKTILVGGLNGGGRGYYALDITVPDTPVLLWEFTTTAGIGAVTDDDLGYSFGVPVVTRKTDGTWVVLVTSGYNNTSPGDGKGYLYVLNAGTGAIISKISTGVGSTSTIAGVCTVAPCPSGLARIAGWNDEPAGNAVGYVYGGDLFGNIWRFDINSAVAAVIGTGDVMKFATLFSDGAGTSPQPITTTPVLGKILDKRVVFIGTGKYLESSDLSTTQVQTQYAIKDDNATATLVNPRNTLVQQFLVNNPDGTASRVSSGSAAATPTAIKAVNFATDRGWYVDFPDSKERVNIDSKLVQGTLLVPTIVPSSTVCSPGGYGWLNYFDYKTGGAVNTATGLASVKYDSTIVGVNVLYIGGQPKVGVVTSTNPTPELNTAVAFASAATGFTGKRVIWRELIP